MNASVFFIDTLSCALGALLCLWMMVISTSDDTGKLAHSPSRILVSVVDSSGSNPPQLTIRAQLESGLVIPAYDKEVPILLQPRTEGSSNYTVLLTAESYHPDERLIITVFDLPDHRWSTNEKQSSITVELAVIGGDRIIDKEPFDVPTEYPRMDISLDRITREGGNQWLKGTDIILRP